MDEPRDQQALHGPTAGDAAAGVDVASRMLRRLRAFAATLSDDERALLAAFLAPSIALAYGEPSDDDVSAYALVDWNPNSLPSHLAAAIRTQRLRIEAD